MGINGHQLAKCLVHLTMGWGLGLGKYVGNSKWNGMKSVGWRWIGAVVRRRLGVGMVRFADLKMREVFCERWRMMRIMSANRDG